MTKATQTVVKPAAATQIRAPELGMTDKEMRFIDQYVIDFKPKEAAIRAGYAAGCASVTASKMLAKEHIRDEIARRQQHQAARCSKTAQDVVEELVKLGFSNMGDYIKISGSGLPYIDLTDLPMDKKAAIQELTVESYLEKGEGDDGEVKDREVKKVKLKLYDKRAALVDLGKHLGVFKENKDTTPQDFEFTVSIGTRNADGSQSAAQVSVRPSMGVRETE